MPRSVDPSADIRVEVHNLHFKYPDNPKPSLTGVSFQLQPGDRVLVIGANGSGKSTLLSILAGRRKPQGNGIVRVMGADPFDVTSMSKHIALIGSPWPPEAVFGNTVEKVASPAPFPERRQAIADALHLRLSRFVDKMSTGEKRRVQVLHGLLPEATLFLLDECSTDIDVVERRTVLEMVKKEVMERNGCCLYATHVFDGMDDWATHVALMRGGRLLQFLPVREVPALCTHGLSVEGLARRFMDLGDADGNAAIAIQLHDHTGTPCSSAGRRYDGQYALTSYVAPTQPEALSSPTGQNFWLAPPPLAPTYTSAMPVVECAHLAYRDTFADLSFTIPQGARVLLCGCNGSGKSTLLNMLGGKQFFPNENGALKVLGWKCYEDMSRVNGLVSYGGDWWVKTPEGEVYVKEMLDISTPRARHLQELLAVDIDWDVRKISSGECKRVQLLLNLIHDKPLVLLDEATADLDVDQRYRLLHFLYAESVQRGVTVVYATHIFNGLEGWGSKIMILDRTRRGLYGMWDTPTAIRKDFPVQSKEGNTELMELRQVPLELAKLKVGEQF